MAIFHRILCPVDFSECSRHALDVAVELASSQGSAITVLHAIHPIPYTDPLMAGAIVFRPEDIERIDGDLRRFVSVYGGRVPIETCVVQGSAVVAILEEARDEPVDLIVMGTHGRGGFEAFMLGSVAERVVRRASCPVLTVPPVGVCRAPVHQAALSAMPAT